MIFPRMPKSLLKTPPGFKKPRVEDFKSDMATLGEEIAEDFKNEIINNIETNKFGFSLADSTVRQKGSDVPFVGGTGQLIDAIYREGTTVSVEDTPRDDSSLSNLQIAIVQEYGTKDKHIPARPVWRKTFKEFKPVAQERIKSFTENPKFKKK